MEVSLWRALLQNISSFLCLSSCNSFDLLPVRKKYQKLEEMLKLLKPILDAIIDNEVSSDDQLKSNLEQIGRSIDEARGLFDNWHPLASRVYLVLQAELLTTRMKFSAIRFFLMLKDSHQSLPSELTLSSLEHCIQKVKDIGCDSTSAVISEAVKDQTGDGPSPEMLVRIADCLGLRSNQEILIEAVALEKLKEGPEQAEKNDEVYYIEQLISVVTRMHDRLVMLKQSKSSTPIPIPPDFCCCPLSHELMTDPVIVASGQTYERAYIRKWLDLGLNI